MRVWGSMKKKRYDVKGYKDSDVQLRVTKDVFLHVYCAEAGKYLDPSGFKVNKEVLS